MIPIRPTTLTSTTHRPLSSRSLTSIKPLEDVYTKACGLSFEYHYTGHGGLGPDEGTSKVYQDILLLSIVYNYNPYGSESTLKR